MRITDSAPVRDVCYAAHEGCVAHVTDVPLDLPGPLVLLFLICTVALIAADLLPGREDADR